MSTIRVEQQVPEKNLKQLEQLTKLPRGAWLQERQDRLSDTPHFPQGLAQRITELQQTKFWFTETPPQWWHHWHTWLQTRKANQGELADWWLIPWILGPTGSVGYKAVDMKGLHITAEHGPHEGFRHEWWVFTGQLNDIPVRWQLARFQPFPDQAVSLLRVTSEWWADQQWHQDEPVMLVDQWDVVQWNFMSFSSPTASWKPDYPAHWFPMDVTWSHQGDPVQLRIQQHQPMYMMRSNGCVVASDGIGLKEYTYPDIRGTGTWRDIAVTFKGELTHRWESGLWPAGISPSIMLRSFNRIEKLLHPSISIPTSWCRMSLHLETGWHLIAYWFPLPTVLLQPHPAKHAIWMSPEGKTEKDPLATLSRQDQAGRVWQLKTPKGYLTLTAMAQQTEKAEWWWGHEQPFRVTGGQDSGQAWMWTTPQEKDTPTQVLNHFHLDPQWRDTYETQPSVSQDVMALSTWLIPLMITLVLLGLMLLLVWVRRRQSPLFQSSWRRPMPA